MLENEVLIGADVDRVWALTVDVERWPEMTPTMTEVTRLDDGAMALGSRARVKQPHQRATVWTVTRFVPGVEFTWSTKVGPITMTGGHHLRATPEGCVNRLTLEVTGFGHRLVERLVGRRIAESIATENQGFKTAAEAPADHPT